jgi:hypothetical protein
MALEYEQTAVLLQAKIDALKYDLKNVPHSFNDQYKLRQKILIVKDMLLDAKSYSVYMQNYRKGKDK